MKKCLCLIILILFLLNCTQDKSKTDEVIVYNNSSKPSNPNFSIEIVEQVELKNDSVRTLFDLIWDAAEDEFGSLYVLSSGKGEIIKFDKNLQFEKSFGGLGSGPGEFTWPQSIIAYKDTLIISDSETKKLNKFDLNGKFIMSYYAPALSQSFSFCKANNYYLSQSINTYNIDESFAGNIKLSLLDSSFNFIKNIMDTEVENSLFLISRISYTATDKFIYIADNRSDRYRIKIFDFNGNEAGVINKNFAMIPFEIAKEGRSKYFNSKYKRAITNLYADYMNNLWVTKSQPDKKNVDDATENNVYELSFDVFKDGKFINEIKFKNIFFEPLYGYLIKTKVIGNRIYSIYPFDNKIVVSKYVIKDE